MALATRLLPALVVSGEQRKLRAAPNKPNDPPPVMPFYYYNTALRVSQWEHPALTHWRSVLCELLDIERRKVDEDHAGVIIKHVDGKSANERPMLWVIDGGDKEPGA